MSRPLVLVSVGNSRTRFALVRDERLEPSRVLVNDGEQVARAIASAAETGSKGDGDGAQSVVIASVNTPAADGLEQALKGAGCGVVRFGRDLMIPVAHSLSAEGAVTVGQDRLLDALGAYARSRQACVVIDAGTAVTVDFVDGEGVFQGGAIAPGVQMMLRALHEQTAALPQVQLSRELLPPPETQGGESTSPFGKDTVRAMALGVASAVRGLTHELIDKYAAFYGAYPRVVATGGDAPLLFENDPLVEAIVPDLTLIGMLEALERLDGLGEAAEGR